MSKSTTAITFMVEKGVPISKSRTSKYDVPPMEVGESILIPKGTGMKTSHSAVKNAIRMRGEKFLSRQQPDGSMRVWRVE